MFLLDRLVLNNVSFYRSAELDLNYRGLTVIRGWNKNAVRAKHKTNGSGKSLLMSTIADLCFQAAPALQKVQRRATEKANLLKEKGSFIQLDTRVLEGSDLVPYSLVKSGKGKNGIGYSILRDGKDMQHRTTPLAEKWLAEFLPFTEDEFFTHTYLDSNRPFVLKVGSPTERAAFFTRMFHLDGYDYVKDRTQAMRRELKDEQIRLDELKKRAAELTAYLDEVDEPALRLQLERLEQKARKLKRKADKLYAQQSDLKLWITHHDTMLVLTAMTADLSEAGLRAALKTKRGEVKEIDRSLSRLLAFAQYETDKAEWAKKTSMLRAGLGDDERTVAELKKELDAAHEVQRKLDRELDEVMDRAKRLKRKAEEVKGVLLSDRDLEAASALLKKYGAKNWRKAIKKVRLKLDLAEAKHAAYSRIAKMAGDLDGGGTCMVCDSKVKHSHAITERLQANIKQFGAKAKELREDAKTLARAQDDQEARSEFKTIKRELTQVNDKLASVQKAVKKLPATDELERLLKLRRQLEHLDEPVWDGKKPKGARKKLERRRSRILKQVALIESVLPVADRLAAIADQYKDRDIEKLARSADGKYKKVRERHTNAVTKSGRIEPILKLWRQRRAELDRVLKEIDEKDELLKDMPVLDMIYDSYSSKGLKLAKMKEYAASLEQTMNMYADTLFHERTRFQFNIEPNAFNLIATSGKGKHENVRDVRRLSGAESRAFAMLTCMSLLHILPSRRRTNVLILDEMDANVDGEGRQVFIDSFLPELGKIVPHIVVVTPQDDEYPGSRAFTAVKEGNQTQLVPVQDHH